MSFIYRHCIVERIIDGDSVALEIDMGNAIHWRGKFRLNGIDTPERGQPGYAEAIEHLRRLLLMPISHVETHKPDKFGRWLVDIHIDTDGGTLHVNRLMIADGHAVEYHGGAKA